VSNTSPKLVATRPESWEARKPEALTFLSLQTSKLSSLPAILLTPHYPFSIIRSSNLARIDRFFP
jgi:hypothetical protein